MDNYEGEVRKLSARKDFISIIAFNVPHVWKAKMHANRQYSYTRVSASSSNLMKKWRGVLDRMEAGK
jgi:hypothetical protein